jgi:hypothetical protein
MTTSFFTNQLFVRVLRLAVPTALLLLGATLTPLRADWPNTNATLWVQYPDKTGYDVLVAQLAGAQPLIVADDFPCRKTGPLTDIHLWTSWLGDTPDQTIPITLSIWSDIPAITNNSVVTPSHPGSLVWSQTFAAGQYKIKAWQTANEQFWNPDPSPAGQILGPDYMIWQYNFYPTNPFVQQGSPNNPLVYWLSVTAGANTAMFGWKTATNHWNDDAVYGHLDPNGNPLLDWKELRDPNSAVNRSLDMAFAITTPPAVTNPPPQTATNKWVQLPDVQAGLDVKATFQSIVADDFPCKAAGTITNIQVWASWKTNATPDPNTVFVVGIWSDLPAGTANSYSRPGNLVWTETFLPGSYTQATVGTGSEQFYDPETGLMSPENVVYSYNFNPKNPFCQKGSTNAPIVYWLSVCAKTVNANVQFGWKTSTNHWNDDAVYGHVNAAGTALGDWKDLHDPRSGISLDLAFLLNNGPPSADCDPSIKPKYVQWPDTSTNGLDVKATVPNILADDFPCRIPGRINGITVWGSWLGDKVDPNVTFQLGLWTDVPKQPGTSSFSHPGQPLCTQTFYPPTSTATSLLRYKSSLAVPNVQERFYEPNLPGIGGLIGNDTQIWRYDFYPNLPCWRQDGGLAAQKVYWLSLVATTTDTNQFLFGWKTTTNHWNDDAVFGHMGISGGPLGDWKDLHDPRTNISLDLSFALRSFPIVSVNKDLINTTPVPVDGIRIVVAGIREVTAHYDDSPPTNWPNFQASYVGGNTVLQWNGKTIQPGELTHVGAEMAGNLLNIVSMAWLQGPTVVGTPIQLNHRLLGNGTVLILANDFVPAPVIVAGGSIEYFTDPTPLDLMKPNGSRTPILTVPLPISPTPVQPGGVMRIPLQQQIPPGARYAMLHVMLYDNQGSPATEDFLQLPLDMELLPAINRAGMMDSFFDVFFSAVPGRVYRVRESPTLQADRFFDIFTELSTDGGDGIQVMIPFTGPQGFIRVVLDPE